MILSIPLGDGDHPPHYTHKNVPEYLLKLSGLWFAPVLIYVGKFKKHSHNRVF